MAFPTLATRTKQVMKKEFHMRFSRLFVVLAALSLLAVLPTHVSAQMRAHTVSAGAGISTYYNHVATRATRASATSPSADLATTITPSGFGLMSNNFTLPIIVTVTNHGPDSADDVVVTDDWGSFSTWFSVAGPNCTSPHRGEVICTTPSLLAGDSITISLTVRVLLFHNQLFSDSATATSSTPDLNTANNSASVVRRIS
jgi:hypothetical protein